MMVRLILDEAADECVQACLRLTGTTNIGRLIADALEMYRASLEPRLIIKEVIYDESEP